jgi:hypothetical protein
MVSSSSGGQILGFRDSDDFAVATTVVTMAVASLVTAKSGELFFVVGLGLSIALDNL